MVYTFFVALLLDIEFKRLYAVNAKNLPIFYANWNTAGKCTKSIRYTDTVLFLTIGKPDEILGKLATVFYPSIRKPERVTNNYQIRLLTYLIFTAIDIQLTNIWQQYIYRITDSRKKYCLH
jgi:hypothetical protein